MTPNQLIEVGSRFHLHQHPGSKKKTHYCITAQHNVIFTLTSEEKQPRQIELPLRDIQAHLRSGLMTPAKCTPRFKTTPNGSLR